MVPSPLGTRRWRPSRSEGERMLKRGSPTTQTVDRATTAAKVSWPPKPTPKTTYDISQLQWLGGQIFRQRRAMGAHPRGSCSG